MFLVSTRSPYCAAMEGRSGSVQADVHRHARLLRETFRGATVRSVTMGVGWVGPIVRMIYPGQGSVAPGKPAKGQRIPALAGTVEGLARGSARRLRSQARQCTRGLLPGGADVLSAVPRWRALPICGAWATRIWCRRLPADLRCLTGRGQPELIERGRVAGRCAGGLTVPWWLSIHHFS
jgi:hypothetical protein